MGLSLVLGMAYFVALGALGIYTAKIRSGWPYVIGCVAFLVAFYAGMEWSVAGEDGPSGFAVIAAHGVIFWIAAIAHGFRWVRVAIAALRGTG